MFLLRFGNYRLNFPESILLTFEGLFNKISEICEIVINFRIILQKSFWFKKSFDRFIYFIKKRASEVFIHPPILYTVNAHFKNIVSCCTAKIQNMVYMYIVYIYIKYSIYLYIYIYIHILYSVYYTHIIFISGAIWSVPRYSI